MRTILALVVSLLATHTIVVVVVNAARPGDDCESSDQCDLLIFLECDLEAKKCRCQDPGTSYYDNYDSKCHKYQGQECLEEGGMACPANGGCDHFNDPLLCQCRRGYETTPSKKCAVGHGSTCSNPTHCDSDSFIFCHDTSKLCACDESSSYELPAKYCSIKLNRDCPDPAGGQPVQRCGEWAECTSVESKFTCLCKEGTEENANGQCKVKLGGSCAASEPCNELNFLHCLEGACGCPPDASHPDPTNTMCVINTGLPCSVEEGTQPCDTKKFVVCINGKCDCDAAAGAFLDPATQSCVLKAGSRCEAGDGKQLCDPNKFLSCEGDTCGCAAGSSLDPATGSCKLNYESVCGEGKPPCDGAKFLSCLEGTCGCGPSASYDASAQICALNAEAICETEEGKQPCGASKFLKCLDGKCSCDTAAGAILDPATQACVLTAGSSCEEGEGKQPCEPSKFLSCVSGKCGCEGGVTPDPGTGSCKLDHGNVCGAGKPPCDTAKFLSCLEGTCGCGPSATYDNSSQICTLNEGVICEDGVDEQPCRTSKFFICLEGKCSCDTPKGAILDPSTQTCVLSHGSNCEDGEGKQQCYPSRFLQCDNGQCGCGSKATLNETGTCVLNFGAPCQNGTEQQQCNDDQFLSCDDRGFCGCTGGNMMYDEFLKKCALVANAPCTGSSAECVQNAQCGTVSGVCECKETFEANVAMKCVRGFGSNCTDDGGANYCNYEGNQGCIDGKCDCVQPTEMVYVDADKLCYTKVNGPCNSSATPPATQCRPPFYICESDKCVCNAAGGFVTPEGNIMCRKTFGSVCDKNDGRDGTCNFSTYTECTNGQCGCATNYQIVKSVKERCVGKHGAKCDISMPANLECLSSASLLCNSKTGTCDCLEKQIYVQGDQRCYSQVGGPCNLTQVVEPEPTLICSKELTCSKTAGSKQTGVCNGGVRLGGSLGFLYVFIWLLVKLV